MPPKARFGIRPALVAATLALAVSGGISGWLYTRGDASSAFFAGIQPDTAVDSPIDTPPDSPPVDTPPPDGPPMSAEWVRHAILSDATGANLDGADGIVSADLNGDGNRDYVVSWEQSARTTVSMHPGCAGASGTWSSVQLPTATSGVEGAVFGDVDGDGRIDVVSAGSSSFRVYVHYAPASNANLLTAAQWTGMTLTAASNTQRFLNAVVADVDGDSAAEIIAGGYSTGASIDIYRSATPRTAGSWTRQNIGVVGALYSIEARDMDGDGDLDIVVSDRDHPNTLKGARWLENPDSVGAAWTNHTIYLVGNIRWLDVSADGKTIATGTGSSTTNTVSILTCGETNPGSCNAVGGSAPAWTKTDITTPTNTGWFNGVRLGDIDEDSDMDAVVVFTHGYEDLESTVWMRNDGGGTWTQGVVSGPEGVKIDNFELLDVDCDTDLDIVLTDEGVRGDPLVIPYGLVWYENPFGGP